MTVKKTDRNVEATPKLKELHEDAGSHLGPALMLASLFLLLSLPVYSGTISIGSSSAGTTGISLLSDGSDGIFDPTQSVNLDLVPDAVFNFSTITIEPTVAVDFNRDGSNVPIYFLATGDILIDGSLDGGSGPLYLSTPGAITLNGSLLGQELTLSGSQIVFGSGATINAAVLAIGNPDRTVVSDSQISVSGGSIQLIPVPIPPSGSLLACALGMWMPQLIRRGRRVAGSRHAEEGTVCG